MKYFIIFFFFICTNSFGQVEHSKFNQVDSQGMCQGFWQIPSGDPHRFDIFEGIYYNDKRIGVWTRKTQEGLIVYRYIYFDTSMHKVQFNDYYNNQNLKSTGLKYPVAHRDTVYDYDPKTGRTDIPIYIDSILMMQGKWIYYHENGEIESIGEYKDDKKRGTWKYFNKRGELLKTKKF